MNQIFRYDFNEDEDIRLDKFLVLQFPDFSRSRLQTFIKDGLVKIKEEVAAKGGMVLQKGDVITIEIPATVETNLIPEMIPLSIIFENEDMMIVNKPAGMVVHPAAGHDSGTLVHAALAHSPEMEGIGGERRPGIVHRLDKDTSGLILLAKNDRTHRFLTEQFRKRTIHKTYLAIIDGFPPTPTGRIEAPIGRDPSHRKKMSIVPLQRGRQSMTEYKVVERFHKHALIEAYPHTGRTHQIRLHLAFLECPILGDTLYGHRKHSLEAPRQMLHAYRIELFLPGETETRIFEAPIPEDMQQVLNILRLPN
ncbi:MAG: RluA family pseudouridine synthase [Chloroflexi bacterium HGW-Chloroflexi-10]|nr:MAG: RluA family pseudouridine synthase [Chloroflexi bacterium HGW-Chloroflexi-10]